MNTERKEKILGAIRESRLFEPIREDPVLCEKAANIILEIEEEFRVEFCPEADDLLDYMHSLAKDKSGELMDYSPIDNDATADACYDNFRNMLESDCEYAANKLLDEIPELRKKFLIENYDDPPEILLQDFILDNDLATYDIDVLRKEFRCGIGIGKMGLDGDDVTRRIIMAINEKKPQYIDDITLEDLDGNSLVLLVHSQGLKLKDIMPGNDAKFSQAEKTFLKGLRMEMEESGEAWSCVMIPAYLDFDSAKALFEGRLEVLPRCCGLYDRHSGRGGTMEVEAAHPIVIGRGMIDNFHVEKAENSGYSLDETYGMTDIVWRSTKETVLKKPKEPGFFPKVTEREWSEFKSALGARPSSRPSRRM